MKTVKKNVYYCDHCKKKGLSAVHIRNHQARCTNNPNRHCGVCEGYSTKQVVADLLIRFTLTDNPAAYDPSETVFDPEVNTDEKLVTWTREPVTLNEVIELADRCPACVLAILRQTGLNRHYFHFEAYDFKGELKSYMSDKIQQHRDY